MSMWVGEGTVREKSVREVSFGENTWCLKRVTIEKSSEKVFVMTKE